MSRAQCLLVVLVLVAACDRPGNPEHARKAAGRALSGALTYPRSTPVTVAAGEEAAQLTMTSQDTMTVIVAWFKRALPLNGWVIQREANGPDAQMSLYAQKGDRPLWITFRPNVGAAGTTYTMIGEIPADPTKR